MFTIEPGSSMPKPTDISYQVPSQTPCPHCGCCPTCGRSNAPQRIPAYFRLPWSPEYWPHWDLPVYGDYEVTCETTRGCPANGTPNKED